jgi:lipopolysaccharide transport system ATP-binding protein
MSRIALRVVDLSKMYRIGALKQRHNTLRDEIAHGFRSLFSRNGRPTESRDTIWAIKDVSFEVKPGDVLGIIGRNGAGKSTLLKILSRITDPTAGRCEIYGHVGSLLEVGTGFHGELTGRENLYLNGAILGMKKAEIERKFDEIVAFAGVEQFIDTPVKRYSSGMHVRLGFAIAAHLEPEVLIVDEVLAVGDLSFQSRCIGKLGDVGRQGRTVLFVSHNMGAVTNLCTTGMWLDHGEVRMCGDVKSVVESYVKSEPVGAQGRADARQGTPVGEARVVGARLADSKGDDCATFLMGETITLEFDVEFYQALRNVGFTVKINRKDLGMDVLQLQSDDCGFAIQQVACGRRRFSVAIPNCMLYPSSYEVSVYIWNPGKIVEHVEGIVAFSMIQSAVTRRTSSLRHPQSAIYYVPSVWKEVSVLA